MHQAQAIIERVRRVSATTQHLDVAVQKPHYHIAAGQLFLARMTDSLDPYLREPWTPVRREESSLIIERPVTQNFAPGDLVNLLGPIGKPIPLREAAHSLLLISYDLAPTALLMLADTALAKGISVVLALVGAALHYSLEALPQEIEIVRGDVSDPNGAWPHQTETLRWADQIVAVAPPPFDVGHYTNLLNLLREVRIEVPANYAYGLFQPPMPCGVGACQACLVRCGKEEIAACVEGPAFDLLSVAALSAGARE